MLATEGQPVWIARGRGYRWLLAVAMLMAVVLVVLAIAVSIELPFGDWDAMAFGIWAREIGDHWPHLRFADSTPMDLHRPFFYFLEGTLWSLFGFHQALGRLLALAFGAVLLGALAYTTGRAAPRNYAAPAAALALALLVASTPFERFLVSGLSDVPVAAMLAATAALLLFARNRPRALPLVAVAACFSVLTKPTAIASLLGLAAAVALGRRETLRTRLPAVAALAGGLAAGLVYDAVQAHLSHVGLRTFLTTGTDGFYATLAAQRRGDALLDESWLGAELRLLLVFAAAYALARLVTTHRRALALALPAALVWSIAGPRLTGGAHGIVSGSAGSVQALAALVLAASLLFGFSAPAEAVPSRLVLARIVAWAVPPVLVWIVFTPYDTRLLSTAWPPLFVLMALALVPALAGAAAVDVVAFAVPVGSALVLAVFGTQQLNGLGSNGWHTFTSSFGNRAAMRSLAVGGDFDAELTALDPYVAPAGQIVTADTRLRFDYGNRVLVAPPTSCAQLHERNMLLVLLESDEERTLYGAKAQTAFWERCRNPTPVLVTERPGAFALFTTGAVSGAPGSCGAAPSSGMAVEFGRFRTERAANALLRGAQSLGFVQAKVERLGCVSYRVVETGVPSRAVGRSIVAEAAKAHLHARVVVTP